MSEEQVDEKSSNGTNTLHRKNILSPPMIFGALLFYFGIGAIFLLKSESNILVIIKENLSVIVGVLISALGLSIASAEMFKIRNSRKEDRFIDIDKHRENENREFNNLVLNEIDSLKEISENITTEKIETIVAQVTKQNDSSNKKMFDSFENYFYDIRNVLIEQAHTADKKASILLDKGTAYSKGGITFYILAIISWQILSWFTGFKDQYIYGIVSCSLLFIFIEFLAAWFLKQYRQFVDTSTYHIKVKSIFDKYMLSHLAIKSYGESDSNVEEKYQSMLKLLEKDISWPESYLLKNGDVSFAKEALETMTHFAKAMRSEVKDTAK